MSSLPHQSANDASALATQRLQDAEQESLRARLGVLIQAREQGIRYAEGRLNSLALLAGGLIATGIALLSLGLSQDAAALQGGLIGVACGLFVLAFSLLLIYTRSTNPSYPFIDATSQVKQARWKWFYWDALPDPRKFATFGLWGRHSESALKTEIAETDHQFSAFVDRMNEGLGDTALDTAEDLRQLYILHINERYKNQYLTNVRRVLQTGLVAALLIGAVSSVTAGLIDGGGSSGGESVQTSEELEIEYSWDQQSSSETSVELVVTMTASNLSEVTFDYSTLRALDAAGFNLPISTTEVQGSVPGNETRTMMVTVTVPASYAEAIREWVLE